MADDGTGEKKHKPTQRKLDDLRRKEGQVAHSRDFPAAVSLIAAFLYFAFTWRSNMDLLQRIFDPLSFSLTAPFGDAVSAALKQQALLLQKLVLPVFGIAIVSYVLTSIAESKGIIFSAKHVSFNMSRISPGSNFKNVFGLQAMSQLGKTLIKVILLIAAVYVIMRKGMNGLFWSPVCGASCTTEVAIREIVYVIIAALIIMLLIAIADIFIARALFNHQNRMSDSDLKRENKEQMGDPEQRKERRRLRNEAAQGGYRGFGNANMLVESNGGAVGIAYVPGKIDTPVVVLKVTGEDYRKLRFEAEGKRVPILEDNQLVEDLMKVGRVGEPVPKALFSSVARALIRGGLVKR
jgi:type III secretion protein U